MKKCAKCGAINEDNALFCTNCGEKLNDQEVNNDGAANTVNVADNVSTPTKPFYAKWGFWLLLVILVGGVIYYINKPNPATYIQASSKQEPFLRTGGTYDMDIDTDGEWQISFCSDWIEAVPTERGLRITCSTNDTGQDRNGWITLSSGKAHVRIDVYQNGFASFVKTDKSHIDVEKDGGTYTILVRTDGSDYDIIYPNYCTVNKSAASFNITIPENTGYDRNDNIIVRSDQIDANLTFSQKGICPNCGGSGQVSCSKCGGTGRVVTSFDSYGMAIFEQCTDCNGSGKMECPTCNGTGAN